MAVKSLYWKNSTATGSSHGRMEEGSPPSLVTTATWWDVGTTTPTKYSEMLFNNQQPAGSFSGTVQPVGNPTNGQCWRSQNPISGTFDAGTWEFESIIVGIIGVTTPPQGRMRCRIYKSSNAQGTSGLTEITTATLEGNQIVVEATQHSTKASFVKGTPVTLEQEYLFCHLAWRIDVAAAGFNSSLASVQIRVGESVGPGIRSRLLTPNFTDGLVRNPNPDSVAVADSVSIAIGGTRLVSFGDTASVTDNLAAVQNTVRAAVDLATVADSTLVQLFQAGFVGLADAVNVSDTASVELTSPAQIPSVRVFVRTNGSDSLGDGSFVNPFRTVAKAADVSGFNDVIEVGDGDFVEMIPIVFNKNLTLKGNGPGRTRVVGSHPTGVITGFTSLVNRAKIQDLTLESTSPGAPLVHIPPTTLSVSGALVIARTVFLPPAGSLAIDDTAPDTVDYDVDVLNCVFFGTNQTGKGILSQKRDRVTVVNSIFKNLEFAVDIGGTGTGQRVMSQNNVFHNNFRNMRVGSLHFSDLESDPLFVDAVGGDFNILFSSPCRDSGRDLNADGYGDNNRLPADPSLFQPSQLGLDRGVFEFVGTTTLARINSTNILEILAAMAAESETFHDLIEAVRRDRFLETASAEALRDKWARFFNAFRIHDPVLMTWTLETWRSFLFELFKVFNDAPASQAPFRLGVAIHDAGLGPAERSEPFLISYYRERRFPLEAALKLKAKRPPNPTLTVTLTAGRFQIDRHWFRMKERDLLLPDDSTSVIYADGTTELDLLISQSEIDAVIFSSTNMLLRGGRQEAGLTGLLTFTQGSTQVVGTGTLFLNELLCTTCKVRRATDPFWYQIASVEDDTHLTLKRAFEQEDIFRKAATKSEVIEVFGIVRTAAGDIVEIKRPGLLGGEVLDSGADGQVLPTTNFRTITGNFTAADIGRRIRITGAANSGNDGIRTIVGIVSSIEVVLASTASMTAESDPPTLGTIDWELIRPGSVLVDTPEGRFGTYEIEMPLDIGSAPQAAQREKLIKQLMSVAKAVAKLGFFKYQDQGISTIL